MAGREYTKLTSPERKADPGNVTVRCGPCLQRLGRSSPALAVVDTDAGSGDSRIFRIGRISARQRDKIRAAGVAENQRLEDLAAKEGLDLSQIEDLLALEELDDPSGFGPDEDADRAPWLPVARADRTRGRFVHPKSVELACPRCPHRPRVRVRELFKLAEQAATKGRAEVYL